ncbi:GOLPH3/VPS74 family protein [Streptomyces wuyuanensis]|uniref:Golgi phosphoprotein 3 (GPP34) n=1 Tax=Streptomyces wuyuanensis TaxID=1196353 RepID=A0A1G9RJD0_9ACTN|nr:GPP34 family phosphoprotein [Streptomyces wuyuanensis]SDM23366.1 Golgi phosphoprotein 3 (GPP34) [Streptomyces wuyuanensis]
MGVTLAEEIMLLSLDDESGAAKERQAAGWAVAGGILLELVMAGRVTVADGRLEVTRAAPTGVALLDGRLEQLAAWARDGRRRKVSDWLTKDQPRAVAATVESLCARGVVTEERHRALGVFPVRRYPEADGSVERELRARLRSAVVDGADPDGRTSGLVALLHGAGLHRQAFPDVPRKQVEPRMAKIAEGHWAGAGVRDAIRNMQAAMAAITTAVVVTTVM